MYQDDGKKYSFLFESNLVYGIIKICYIQRMSLMNRYTVIETLHDSDYTVVYRARKTSNSQQVIIKRLKSSVRNQSNLNQFINEREILSSLHHKRIPRLLDVTVSALEYFFVFEDIEGYSLNELIVNRRIDRREALQIGYSIAEALEFLHKKNIIHGDINPKNIIYNPRSQELQIIDFGNAFVESGPGSAGRSAIPLSDEVFYTSPEQIGKTGQTIDKRSDFYSFGMTLYHLFLGHIPFEAKNRSETIHKQVAYNLPRLDRLKFDFPSVLASMIQKLIEKNPSARYQSDQAILYDLKECIRLYRPDGQIDPFEIGTQDMPVIRIGSRLFGRDEELKLLKKASEQAILEGKTRLIISGESGIGKTRLIQEYIALFSAQEMTVFRGKFDQSDISLPYIIFKQIMSQISTFVMSQKTGTLKIGLHPRSEEILCFIFPELRTLFANTKKEAVYTHEEIVSHLPYAVCDFLDALAKPSAPLMVVIDDLQWGDFASIELIQKAIVDTENPYIHLSILYRENELRNNPHALSFIEHLKQNSEGKSFEICLAPLQEVQILEMVKELFQEDGKKASALASVIYKKTYGIPFHVKTLLEHLIETQEFSFRNGRWVYSPQRIKEVSSNANILQIINQRFLTVAKDERRCLSYLALLGNRFDLALTQRMLKTFAIEDKVVQSLEEKGFIELIGDHYEFVHDQIQYNVYESIGTDDKRHFHRQIAKFLKQAYDQGDYGDLISVVYHLNRAFQEGQYPKRLLKLNIQALQEYLNSNSYELALRHLQWIEKYLLRGILSSEQNYLFLDLKIKIFYLNGLHEDGYRLIPELITKSKIIEEKLRTFTLFKNICVTYGKHFDRLIEFGNQLLGELNVDVPGSAEAFGNEVEQLNRSIVSHRLFDHPQELASTPRITNRRLEALLRLLVDYWEAGYYLADIIRMQWTYFKIVSLSMKRGNSRFSPFGYVLYGAWLISEKNYSKGYAFGKAALEVNELFNDEVMLPKVYNFFANFINPYVKNVHTNIRLYQKSLLQSKINGDIVFGTWANFLMHLSEFFSGNSLELCHTHLHNESTFLLKSGDEKMIAILNVLGESIRYLREPDAPAGESDASAVEMWEQDHFYPALAWYAIIKAQNALIEGKIDQGLELLDRYVYSEANEVIMFPKIRLHFIRALLLFAKNDPLSLKQQSQLENDIQECETYMSGSIKFKSWSLLFKTEQNKRKQNVWDSAKGYDRAIEVSRKHSNPFFAALSALCASRFWYHNHQEELSFFYHKEAMASLAQWGAYGAVKRLENIQNSLNDQFQEELDEQKARNESENFISLLNSFSTISKATELDPFLRTLMQIIAQNATASKSVLLLRDGDEFWVKAILDIKEKQTIIIDQLYDENPEVPSTIINYTINTAERVLLVDPSEKGEFSYDPYIQSIKPGSCYIIPTLLDGQVEGVLYLENREVAIPLSSQTLQTLELILTQAVIVYRNMMLYTKLKQSEETLFEANEMIMKLSQVVHQNPFSTIITDPQGRIVYVNQQAIQMTGYGEAEMIGQQMNLFSSGTHSKEFYAQMWNTIAVHQQLWRGTIINRMKDHRLVDCASTIFPLFNKALKVTNFVTIQEDVTEKNVKERLFLIQTRQAQMGEMISMIAHQWRQPLAIISSLINKQRVFIALERSTMDDVSKNYDDIDEQVRYLSRTITDFRDFFKPDKEKIPTKNSTIVNKALSLVTHMFKQKNIAVAVETSEDDEYETYEHEMVQVVLNLLKNAQDAIEERQIQNPFIAITTGQSDGYSIIEVEDNAGGIDETVINTLFLPYISTKTEQNGTGLGLYMSNSIVTQHCSGSIEALNTAAGAKFVIKIPIKGTDEFY